MPGGSAEPSLPAASPVPAGDRIPPDRRRRWLRALLLLPPCALALVVVAAVGLDRGWWRVNHPDPARYPVWGLDVSHHQGRIDWASVAREPRLAFAFIKATEGGDFVDPRFEENWREARRAGLRVGAYHFFTFCRDPLEQASHFLSVLPRDPDALPPAVDLEFGGNCRADRPRAAVRADVRAWLAAVQAATGRRPILYTTNEGYDAFVAGDDLLAARLWVRDLWHAPALPAGGRWMVWQFAHRERVRGIAEFVDLDVVDGELARLDAP